jgi:hypothetical protein
MNRKSDTGSSSKALKGVPAGDGGPNRMDRKLRIECEVDETLRAFERDAAPQPRSDFFARVQARVRNDSPAPRTGFALPFRRRVLLPAALALMVALNVFTAVTLARKSAFGESATAGRRQAAMLALAEEYDLKPSAEAGYWK